MITLSSCSVQRLFSVEGGFYSDAAYGSMLLLCHSFMLQKTTDYALIPLYYDWKIHAALWQLELGARAWFRYILDLLPLAKAEGRGAFRMDSKEGQQLHPSIHQSGHAGWSQNRLHHKGLTTPDILLMLAICACALRQMYIMCPLCSILL